MDTVTGGKLAAVIVGLKVIDVPGRVPAPVSEGVIIVPDEAEPTTSITLHYPDLRQYDPARGRPSGETMVSD